MAIPTDKRKRFDGGRNLPAEVREILQAVTSGRADVRTGAAPGDGERSRAEALVLFDQFGNRLSETQSLYVVESQHQL